jgi:hypothetical protein
MFVLVSSKIKKQKLLWLSSKPHGNMTPLLDSTPSRQGAKPQRFSWHLNNLCPPQDEK